VLRSNVHLLGKLGRQRLGVGGRGRSSRPASSGSASRRRRASRTPSPTPTSVMMLRIQMERMQGHFFPSLREYFTLYGLTRSAWRWHGRTPS
jgi:aspartate carbamoyltransferase catalytic subunit